MDYRLFASYCKDDHDEETRKEQYLKIRKFCCDAMNNAGDCRRMYYYAPGKKFGRRSCPESVQPIDRHFRGLLCRGLHTDLDMDNCHPTILMWICDAHRIECPYLKAYVKNRDYHLAQVEQLTGKSRDEGKRLFLIATNSEDDVACEYPFLKLYDAEMKQIQRQIAMLPHYTFIKPHVEAKIKKIDQQQQRNMRDHKKKTKPLNYLGTFINLVLCDHESAFMDVAMLTLLDNGYEPSVLVHDGCMIHGDHYPSEVLRTTNSANVFTADGEEEVAWEVDDGYVTRDDCPFDLSKSDSYWQLSDWFGSTTNSANVFTAHGESKVAIQIKQGTLNEAEWADHFLNEKPITSVRDEIICPMLEIALAKRFGVDMNWSMKFHTTRLICPDRSGFDVARAATLARYAPILL